MPVILEKEHHEAWMGEKDQELLQKLMRPLPDNKMQVYKVSDLVNKVSADGPELIRPLAETDLFSADY
jgi:putative SOS response-associated peptidase YedK